MNSIIISGRLTRDPEMKTSESGVTVTRFGVAVDRNGKNAGADFFNCSAFGKTAELVSKHFYKGKPIILRGRMESYRHDERTDWSMIIDAVEFVQSDKGQQDAGAKNTPVSDPYIGGLEDADGELPF